MKNKSKDVVIPLDVPKNLREKYVKNYLTVTRESGLI